MTNTRLAYLGLACLAVIGAIAACDVDDDAGSPPTDAASNRPDARDSAAPAVDAHVVLPSFCNGIVLYASFDTGAAPQLGAGEPRLLGTARQLPTGRFGGGLGLVGEVSDDDGAALYFVRPDGGEPVFPENEGTLAMWIRGNITEGQPVYYRPVGSLPPETLVSAGLSLVTTGGRFGLASSRPGLPLELVHAFPVATVRPYLREDDFNHVATSWRRGDAAGPTAYLTINGGQGQSFVKDAGADAADPYADAGPNDAGTLAVPYRGYSSTKWDYEGSAVALRLGAPNLLNAPDATIDDTAVWDRVLSFDEVAAVYKAGVSIREACHLP